MKTTNEVNDTLENEENSRFIRGVQWLALKLKILDDDATPPNWKHILQIFACLFASSCCLTFLFPFLPEMIVHFGYSENEKATYGGMIAASLFAGRIFGSMFWGWLTDRKGRKFVLALTLLLTGSSAGLFGFSDNLAIAITLRFLCGLFNGIVGTSKTVLYDVSDNTNQALGMTMLSLAWGAGLVTGPLLGGLLATPCTKWPDFCDNDSLFGRFPFLLPSLFPCIASLAVFILIMLTFEDTFVSASKRETFSVSISQEADIKDSKHPLKPKDHLLIHRSFSENEEHRAQQPVNNILSRSVISLCPEAEMSVSLGKEVLLRQESMKRSRCILEMTTSQPELLLSEGFDAVNLDTILSKSTSHIQKGVIPVDMKIHNGSVNGGNAQIYKLNGTSHKGHNGTIISQPKVSVSVENETSGNNTYSVGNYNREPLLHQSEPEEHICKCCDRCFSFCCVNSSLHKLLRLSDIWSSIMLYTVLSFATIGIEDIFPMFASTQPDNGGLGFSTNEIGMSLGLLTLPLLFLQVKIYPFLVSKLSVRKTFMLMVLVCLVSSQSIPLVRSLNNSPTWLWVCMVLIHVPYKIAINCCFASTSILINNSAPQELAGQANGLSMTTTAIGRTIAPIVAGLLFSWSVTYGQFIGIPFDTGFPFFVLGITYAVAFVECLFLNPQLDKQKK